MLIEQVELGPTPSDESCAQVGSDRYSKVYRVEGKTYIAQLIRTHGEPPEGAYYWIVGNSHDFGTYHDVVIRYDPCMPAARDYALKVEGDCPIEWDDQARADLLAANVCCAVGCEHNTIGCVEYPVPFISRAVRDANLRLK